MPRICRIDHKTMLVGTKVKICLAVCVCLCGGWWGQIFTRRLHFIMLVYFNFLDNFFDITFEGTLSMCDNQNTNNALFLV